jgi:sec-independent protein translocase protein TatA
MGLDSFWHWIILLIVVLVIFGTGKLSKIGPDLGNAMRGFKKAMQGDDDEEEAKRKAQEQLRADPPADGTADRARDKHDAK